jgi:hypothetical protein
MIPPKLQEDEIDTEALCLFRRDGIAPAILKDLGVTFFSFLFFRSDFAEM